MNPDDAREMTIYGVSFDMVGSQPIVLLKAAESKEFLPIWIGHPEAAAILMCIQGTAPPRPMTHDLFCMLLDQLGANCARIYITELRDNTFFAQIDLELDGQTLELDARPSDALAIAVRLQAPIFVANAVLETSAVEFEHADELEEDVVEQFKDFLDEVTPDDFAGGTG